MKIIHNPVNPNCLDIAKRYSEKENTKINYVLTSDIHYSDHPFDIFYRENPHPEFGNRYFGISQSYITNADKAEDWVIGMIRDSKYNYYYSRSHHDCISIPGAMIDGGREYLRGTNFLRFRIRKGKFEKIKLKTRYIRKK